MSDAVTIPLTQLRRGQSAVVGTNSLEQGDAAFLRALGVRPECRVRLCRHGEPCILELRNGCSCSRIGLARSLAERVMVTPA